MNRKLGKFKTTPNLSSDTFFHFTSEFRILELILRNGFQSRYIYEKLPGRKLAYFTMATCFCDIPLGMIKEHINWYGAYGIGINRTIAQDYGFSPVYYIHSESPNYPQGISEKSIKWFEDFLFTNYLKRVRGQQIFYNDNNTPYWKWKTFYNEREWKYFPAKKQLIVKKYTSELELESFKVELNKNDLPFLKFEPDWIEYILIRDSNELDDLIKILNSNKYKNDLNNLLTKVITCKQILKDF